MPYLCHMKKEKKYTTQRVVSYAQNELNIEAETAFIEKITLDELKKDLPQIAHMITRLISTNKIEGSADLEDYCIIALIKKISDTVRVTILQKRISEFTGLKKHAVIKRLEKLRGMSVYVSQGTHGTGHRYPIFNSDLFTF